MAKSLSQRPVGIGVIGLTLLLNLLMACQSPTPKIHVEEVWSRPAMGEGATAMPHQGGTGVVYLTLVNKGNASDRLIGVQSDVCKAAELHQTKMENNRMTMQPVNGGIEVPAKGSIELKPGSYHIMLIGLKKQLKVGDRFPVVLTFEKSGTLSVESEVRQP